MTGEEIRLHKGSVTLRNIILQKMYRIKHREEMGWTGVKCQDREMKKKNNTPQLQQFVVYFSKPGSHKHNY